MVLSTFRSSPLSSNLPFQTSSVLVTPFNRILHRCHRLLCQFGFSLKIVLFAKASFNLSSTIKFGAMTMNFEE